VSVQRLIPCFFPFFFLLHTGNAAAPTRPTQAETPATAPSAEEHAPAQQVVSAEAKYEHNPLVHKVNAAIKAVQAKQVTSAPPDQFILNFPDGVSAFDL
jgi:hypothetical protein